MRSKTWVLKHWAWGQAERARADPVAWARAAARGLAAWGVGLAAACALGLALDLIVDSGEEPWRPWVQRAQTEWKLSAPMADCEQKLREVPGKWRLDLDGALAGREGFALGCEAGWGGAEAVWVLPRRDEGAAREAMDQEAALSPFKTLAWAPANKEGPGLATSPGWAERSASGWVKFCVAGLFGFGVIAGAFGGFAALMLWPIASGVWVLAWAQNGDWRHLAKAALCGALAFAMAGFGLLLWACGLFAMEGAGVRFARQPGVVWSAPLEACADRVAAWRARAAPEEGGERVRLECRREGGRGWIVGLAPSHWTVDRSVAELTGALGAGGGLLWERSQTHLSWGEFKELAGWGESSGLARAWAFEAPGVWEARGEREAWRVVAKSVLGWCLAGFAISIGVLCAMGLRGAAQGAGSAWRRFKKRLAEGVESQEFVSRAEERELRRVSRPAARGAGKRGGRL